LTGGGGPRPAAQRPGWHRRGRPVDAGGRGRCGNRAGRDHNGTPRSTTAPRSAPRSAVPNLPI